jgi:shikimate 5-dehydrogenase
VRRSANAFRHKQIINGFNTATGGSSGIGKAAAIRLARLGANITILARTRSTYASPILMNSFNSSNVFF